MNKKGFTLIEIIAVLGLLALATIIISANLISMNNKQKQKEYERLVSKIVDATQTYNGLNINDVKETAKKNGSVTIDLSDLVEEGLIDEEDLVDPRGNKEIPLTNIVIISYKAATYEFSYLYNYN